MDTDRWQQIQDLFERALDRPTGERSAFLAEVCEDDPALLREVQSLLAADETGHSLLDGLAVDALDPEDADDFARGLPSSSTPYGDGDRIGPYRLVRRLATGGMGTVFLAERADGQFQQQVALKLIRSGLASDLLLQRFHRERQILARLQHPHIARLLDGGLTDRGEPYFAMEYIDGTPLTAYCDDRRLTVAERLQLFVKIGQTVQYAHRNLIVHRDLKPSNILVTGDGTVTLLDFGIAKVLTDDDDAHETALTRTGMRVMTPEYAAPEQIRGELVTTATDVYSLGVLLYELLTGQRPHERARRWEVEQAVLQTEPEKPSVAVLRAAGGDDTRTLALVGQTRSTSPDFLARRLRGDLDVICQKALQKRPDDRYESVEQFVTDVQRHLAGLPIVARRPTAEYRLRKFVQRHRTGVIASASVVVLIIALVSFYTLRLAHERDRAQQEAAKATQIADFLTALFQASDPGEALGDDLTARMLLEQGAERIETELADQPEVQARMMAVIGNVYRQLGLYDEARPLLEQALAQRRALHGEEHLDVVISMHDLGHLLQDIGAYDEAVRLFKEALALNRRLPDAEANDIATGISNVGYALHAQGAFEEAETYLQDALALARASMDDDPEALATELNNYGMLVYDMGRYEEADRLLEEAVAIRRDYYDGLHPILALTINNLADVKQELGAYAEAESLYVEALAMRRQIYGEEHPDLSYSYNNLGLLRWNQGRLAQAEADLRTSLALDRQFHGEEHPNVATTMTNLGGVLREQGRLDEAEAIHRAALRMKQDLLGDDHLDVIISKNSLANLLGDLDDHEGAERLFQEVYDGLRHHFGDEHPYIAIALNNLAGTYQNLGRLAEAEETSRASLALNQHVHGEVHGSVATSHYTLGLILRDQEKLDEAEMHLTAAADIFQAASPDGSLPTARAHNALGLLLQQRGRLAEAEPHFRKSLSIRQAALPADHAQVDAATFNLADCLIDLDRFDDAEALLTERYRFYQQPDQANPERAREAAQHLARLYEAWGRPDQAASYRVATSSE